MRQALNRNDEALSQLSFGTKKCIWPKGGLRNTFYLFILNLSGYSSLVGLVGGGPLRRCDRGLGPGWRDSHGDFG